MFRKILFIALLFSPGVMLGKQHAKNVILFLGDAGGIPTLSAASIHGYQRQCRKRVSVDTSRAGWRASGRQPEGTVHKSDLTCNIALL
jgi:hypothetical protein